MEKTLVKNTAIPSMVSDLDVKIAEYLAYTGMANSLATSFIAASTIAYLRENMTDEFMRPIMALQGTKIGFLTDKDRKKVDGVWVKGDGYDISVVKDMVIEAKMNGLEIMGNHWNIISDRFYITKEGFQHLLNKMPDLEYDYTYSVPIQNANNKSSEVKVKIDYTYKGESKTKELTLTIKSDQWASADSILGKAERKAGCWLVNKLKGTTYTDGDASEIIIQGRTIVEQPSVDEKHEKLVNLFEENKDVIAPDDKIFKRIQAVIAEKKVSAYDSAISHIEGLVNNK